MEQVGQKIRHFLLVGGVPFFFVVVAPATLLTWYVRQPEARSTHDARLDGKAGFLMCTEPQDDTFEPEDPTL